LVGCLLINYCAYGKLPLKLHGHLIQKN